MSSSIYFVEAPPPEETPEETHAPAIARGARCKECPLYGLGNGPVMGEVRPKATLTIVGEAPGINEVSAKQPFVGWSGGVLNAALGQGGLRREDCTITNTILCMPDAEKGNYKLMIDGIIQRHKREVRRALARGEPAPAAPILPDQACAPRLERDIDESGSKVVLAVGKRALEAVAAHYQVATGSGHVARGRAYCASIKKQHGAPVVLDDGRVIMASYHPAMAAPGRGRCEFLPLIRENLARAATVARNGGQIDWREPVPLTRPTADQVVQFCKYAVRHQLEVTADIETGPSAPGKKDAANVYANIIRCVGLGVTSSSGEEFVMVVPFRQMDGAPYWPDQRTKTRVALALREVFDKCPLVFQNGQFDTSVLLRYGLMTDRNKPWTDTMLLHHDTPDNDLPHDLGFIARRLFTVPMWKADIDHKSVDVDRYDDLLTYNAKDVLITMRCVEPLRNLVDEYGTTAQYATDYYLAPVLREMGEMGLVIDEQRRGEFSRVSNQACVANLKKLRDQVGDPTFNPRSVPDLQRLIYQTWGYVPVIGTDGYEINREDGFDRSATWKDQLLVEDDAERAEIEDEFGSTSSGAILELIKRRDVNPDHVKVFETLLEFRAWDKLRGTYIDNLKVRPVDWAAQGMEVGRAEEVSEWQWDAKAGRFLWRSIIPERSAFSLLNTSYKGHIIPTGRVSTVPAVQNWPALGKANMREMVVSPPGHVLVGADYAQLEARLYALAAGDQLLLEAIRDGRDIHSMNAATLMAENLSDVAHWYQRIEHGEGVEPSQRKEFRKYWRTVAKRFAFLEIYGGEEDKLFSVMAAQRNKTTGALDFPNLKRSDVKRWHMNWHTLHPWTKKWHAFCHQFYRQTGYIAIPDLDGRKRFFPGGLSKKNAVPNMTIQGRAASIANRALLALAAAIPFRSWSPWTGACLQVHDYIGLYVPAERAPEAERILAECMYYEADGVPFPAEPSTSFCWAKQD